LRSGAERSRIGTKGLSADGGEDDVGGIADAAFEIAAAETAFRLQVSDDGLDGGSAGQFALDDT
jgi:hypothetical protein